MTSIESKLQSLREEWTKYPERRDIILRMVKALKHAQKPYKNKSEEKHELFVEQVLDNLT